MSRISLSDLNKDTLRMQLIDTQTRCPAKRRRSFAGQPVSFVALGGNMGGCHRFLAAVDLVSTRKGELGKILPEVKNSVC